MERSLILCFFISSKETVLTPCLGFSRAHQRPAGKDLGAKSSKVLVVVGQLLRQAESKGEGRAQAADRATLSFPPRNPTVAGSYTTYTIMTFLSSLDFRVNGQEGTSGIRASVVTTSRSSMQKSSIHLKAMTESSMSLVIRSF